MHLKSDSPLVGSELHVDPASIKTSSQRSSFRVNQQGALLRTRYPNQNIINGGRLPLSEISTNTLHCSNATNNSSKVSSSMMTSIKMSSNSFLPLHPLSLSCENETLHQTAGDAPLDIWAVIKPGHVREKIAIFTSDGCTVGAVAGCCTLPVNSNGKERMAFATNANQTPMSGVSRAMKAKGGWKENSGAKRRRRSGSNHNQHVQQDMRVRRPTRCSLDVPLQPGGSSGKPWGGEVTAVEMEEEEEELKVSVVEMVTFLEQRASEQQLDFKPLLSMQRSSTTITLCRALPPEVKQGSEDQEPESIRVSEIVAKLESDYLKRRAEGDLSRNNSLRRTVERVLLAESNSVSSQPPPPSSSSPQSELLTLSSSKSSFPTRSCASNEAMPPSPARATSLCFPKIHAACDVVNKVKEAQSSQSQSELTQTVAAPLTPPSADSPQQPERDEPLAGLLFLSQTTADSHALLHAHMVTASSFLDTLTEPESHLPLSRMNFELCLNSYPVTVSPQILPHPASFSCNSESPTEKPSCGEEEQYRHGSHSSTITPLARSLSVSQDFLQMRQRLQQLLEPQLYLSVLPHHLLLKIFLLLPTHSLAALKCTCHYFKFIIENYDVRPADSLWVSDSRYRDDPCKQCKKRYGHGDVSLCRWHHKPFCQALPYGPGYWMCCHGTQRNAPGCNVGLHDNRWVPAFHSFNMPICRKSPDNEDD
ncbi:F-box only protein 34 [Genypterus blacodes]|uniref:F-box only protein 34 n=1 Tax=Genypterus blacodes TaxID=154954 RepID=UPI003F7707AB